MKRVSAPFLSLNECALPLYFSPKSRTEKLTINETPCFTRDARRYLKSRGSFSLSLSFAFSDSGLTLFNEKVKRRFEFYARYRQVENVQVELSKIKSI